MTLASAGKAWLQLLALSLLTGMERCDSAVSLRRDAVLRLTESSSASFAESPRSGRLREGRGGLWLLFNFSFSAQAYGFVSMCRQHANQAYALTVSSASALTASITIMVVSKHA